MQILLSVILLWGPKICRRCQLVQGRCAGVGLGVLGGQGVLGGLCLCGGRLGGRRAVEIHDVELEELPHPVHMR
eukprot:4088167-Alexandrium_andersonii.AAC.1